MDMDVKYMLVEFMTVNFGQVSMSLQPFVCVCAFQVVSLFL